METCETVNLDCSSVTYLSNSEEQNKRNLYMVEDKPPFVFLFFNALQILICQVVSVVWLPLALSQSLCLLPADPVRVYLVATAIFASGIITSLQSTLGIRLPTVAAPSALYSVSLISLLQSPALQCPSDGDLFAMGPALRAKEWQGRLQEVQGALLLAGAAQTFLGFSGVQSFLCSTLSPVSLAPTIIVAGFTTINTTASEKYLFYIPVVPMGMFLFALGLRDICLPVPTFSLHSGLTVKRFPLFRMFSVLWTSVVVYLIYKLLPTMTTLYPNTDLIGLQEAVDNSKWFFIPFPFEWGLPTMSMRTVVHLLPAVMLQSVTSLSLIYANANVCGVGLPPRSAISRSLGVEGLGLMFSSLWGHGINMESTNIGLMSFTGIVSRSSVQLAAMMMICMSHFPGFVSLVANLPTNFLFAVQLFLQIGLVITGISFLKFINFNSSRDTFIVGFSLVFGLLVPQWMSKGLTVNTDVPELDHFISQCLSSSVCVAMVIGCLLDLILPGRISNQKTHPWRRRTHEDKKTYRLPTWEELLCSVLEKLPFFSSD